MLPATHPLSGPFKLPFTENAVWPVILAPFIGSFLGTLVLRLPKGESVIGGRSACPACGHPLGPLDLVPVVSWLLLRGRCRHCGTAVSPFYPAIELAALAVAFWAGLAAPEDEIWESCALGWSLLTLACIDGWKFLLPDLLTLPLLAAGLLAAFPEGSAVLTDRLAGAGFGFGMFWMVRTLYRHLRRREGLGGGDVKLLAASGAWVGIAGIPSVILIAATTGLAGALLKSAITRKPLGRRSRIPLGLFLALGTWLVWLYGPLFADAPAFVR